MRVRMRKGMENLVCFLMEAMMIGITSNAVRKGRVMGIPEIIDKGEASRGWRTNDPQEISWNALI